MTEETSERSGIQEAVMSNKSRSFLRRAVCWLFRHPVRHYVIFSLSLFHGMAVYFYVQTVDPDTYRKWWTTDLRVTPKWRYGYFQEYHGAHLCKARNLPEAVPKPRTEDEELSDKELTAAMMRQLDDFPRKAWSETLFFAGLVGFIFWLGPWLWRKLAPPGKRPVWAVCLAALLWMLGWALTLSPFLISNYGASLYTTYAGPGALVYSGPYPGLVSGLGGETLSYRPILEVICLFPLLFVEATRIGNWLPASTLPFLLVAGLMFCGILGAIVGLVRWLWIWADLRLQASLAPADQHAPESSENEEHKEGV